MTLGREPERVRAMFDRIAKRYDLANHLLSLGLDVFWRRAAARRIRAWNAPCLLDLATGSGDLAILLQRIFPSRFILGVDFSSEMLAQAKRKGLRHFLQADALKLPFPAGAFDAITIAFGLRNMHDWSLALKEARRVLTSQGRLLLLDFSLPESLLLRICYRFYLHSVIPRLCHFLTGQGEAYQYLGSSIEEFPHGHGMVRLLSQNGFTEINSKPMSGGIVSLYTARVRSGSESAPAPRR